MNNFIYIVMEHTFETDEIYVTPHTNEQSAIKHYQEVKATWEKRDLTLDEDDDGRYFTATDWIECRIYREELRQ